MSSITKRPNGKWRARYRDASGKEHARHFNRRTDGQAWLDTIAASVQTGTWADPARGRLTIEAWSGQWLEHQAHLKPSTRERYAGILRQHIVPSWGPKRLVDVSHSDVQAWISGLAKTRSAATVHKVHRVLSLIFKSAIRDGRLSRNPADGISLPRVSSAERRFLTHQQVIALAQACSAPPVGASKHGPKPEAWNPAYRLIVLFLAYTGVRWGEMAALRVGRIDFLRRRALIAESVTVVRGELTWGTPKGHDRREVPIPESLLVELAKHVEGKDRDDLVFSGAKGGPLRSKVFQDAVLRTAAKAVGVAGLTPHGLRHTAASLAIASGANVKVVQQMLGHKSATMTLDLYGHLFGDDLDAVADRMEAAAQLAREDPADHLRTEAVVVALPRSPRSAEAQ